VHLSAKVAAELGFGPPVIPDKKPHRLVVWCHDARATVISTMAHALKPFPDLQIEVVSSMPAPSTSTLDTVFALGKKPLEQLQALGLVAKNRTVTSLRDSLSLKTQDGRPLLVSFSPSVKEVSYDLFVDLICDATTAARVAATGSPTPPMGKYKWVDDFAELIAEVEAEYELTKKPVTLSFDTETQNTDPWEKDSRFVTLQFTRKAGTGVAVFIPDMATEVAMCATGSKIYEQMKWLLQSPKVMLRAANGKYDFIWVWVRFELECKNFRFDTTLVGNLLDENRSNSLDVHAKWYGSTNAGYSDVFDRTVDKSQMQKVPKNDFFLQYAVGDTDATQQVGDSVRADLLKDSRLTAFYINVLHPAARGFEIIERGGVCIDKERFAELDSDCRKELDLTAHKAIQLVGGRIYAKHKDDTKPGGLALTKPSFIKDFMFSPMGLDLKPKMHTAKSGEPSTAWEHLQMFKDVPEARAFLELQDAYSTAAKTLSTFCIGFLEHLRGDGRLHPSYFLSKSKFDDDSEGGTVTGRLSAKKPAMQVVPKHTNWAKRIRRCFVAPQGFVLVERDFSQGELRVVADIAHEENMLQAYRDGKDLHVLTGAKIAGLSYDYVMGLALTDPDRFDLIRQPAKPANFGLLYGQGVEGFRHFAELNYNIKLSYEEAAHIRTVFFELYPELITYHHNYKAFAHKHGFVRSPLGRIRHLPLINSKRNDISSEMERKAINSPVQGALSDLMLWAIGLEWQAGMLHTDPVFAVIHDAAYDYVREGYEDLVIPRKKEIMENLPFEKVGWNPKVKFVADVKTGPDMASLKKFKPKLAA